MMQGTIIRPAAAPARGWHRKVRSTLAALAARLRRYRQLQRERAQLLALTDRELRDAGITRVDAQREAHKPLWR